MDAIEREFRMWWERVWGRVGEWGKDPEEVVRRYTEAVRVYHGLGHIVFCLKEVERVGGAEVAVELAVLFHDVIYDPRRGDNEEASARVAQEYLAGSDLAADVERLILATDHKRGAVREDEQLMVDVDLAILGQRWEVFEAYERGIRAEYGYVEEGAFRAGRAKLLRGFLARERIYLTAGFLRYEGAARRNLAKSIASLEGG